jgi:hypothetical protein
VSIKKSGNFWILTVYEGGSARWASHPRLPRRDSHIIPPHVPVGVSSHRFPGARPHSQFNAKCRSTVTDETSFHSESDRSRYAIPRTGKSSDSIAGKSPSVARNTSPRVINCRVRLRQCHNSAALRAFSISRTGLNCAPSINAPTSFVGTSFNKPSRAIVSYGGSTSIFPNAHISACTASLRHEHATSCAAVIPPIPPATIALSFGDTPSATA